MAPGEYRRQWHKYLPLAVLNYNTTYDWSIGCEPSKVLNGRIPHNVRYQKLGNIPNETFCQLLNLQKKYNRGHKSTLIKEKNIMQSYLKYKDYNDRKAKAAPLKQKGYCFILQPKSDSQA